MPTTLVIFYKEEDGSVPVLEWLDNLPQKAQDKCRVRIERLADLGHELRRPEADFLRDKIYELRVSLQGIQYRILYFFYENTSVVLSHGIIKEREVPPKEIDRAIQRKKSFEENPEVHTYKEQEQ
ncbi:type II toxin-antitoxin system RelE/ParE family toxin [Scytonema sp. UIC 10036]|uniref:type II toxin-antitoxin system RelE/ParE family toxin n=1 Tax=Scytonema sp. UIC 10036 TaxID=2304196 RepID=UPI00137D80EB|nr:type II toxin-antitoxin system RelE/ParE family toxin [Scytonema sp. UIC 10036]